MLGTWMRGQGCGRTSCFLSVGCGTTNTTCDLKLATWSVCWTVATDLLSETEESPLTSIQETRWQCRNSWPILLEAGRWCLLHSLTIFVNWQQNDIHIFTNTTLCSLFIFCNLYVFWSLQVIHDQAEKPQILTRKLTFQAGISIALNDWRH